MSSPQFEAIAAVLNWVSEEMKRSRQFRAAAEALSRWVIAELDQSSDPVVSGGAPPAPEPDVLATRDNAEAVDQAAVHPAIPVEVAVSELQRALANQITPIIQHSPPIEPRSAARAAVPFDPAIVARRCKIKADALTWAVRRNEIGFDPLRTEYDQLRAEADRVQPCYLWGINRDTERLDREQIERCAGAYRCLAGVLDILAASPEMKSDPDTLALVAEAQSTVMAALASADGRYDDDQRDTFRWVREAVAGTRQWIDYLSEDQLADPGTWRGLLSRIEVAADRARARVKSRKTREQSLNTVRYHAKRIIEADEHDSLDHDWSKLSVSVRQLLDAGSPPSNPELVGALAPLVDLFPEELPDDDPLQRVMPWVDQQAAAGEASHAELAPAKQITPEILRARELLRGRVAVIIGGICRPQSKRLIERELELRELRWPSTREHQSIEPFRAQVQAADVDLVILAIRWSGHAFEGVKQFCDDAGKAYVRLPGGYNTAQIAHHVLAQVSNQFSASPASSRLMP